MGSSIESKVIRPPVENISSGKIFKPSNAFIYKSYLQALLIAFAAWTITMLIWMGFGYLLRVLDDGILPSVYWGLVHDWWIFANLLYWGFTACWIIPGFIIWPLYVRRIEYSVISKSGEVMPEIYVRKGLITITEKHVPFRTITNISSKAGPFDRLFGIGAVEIQTAGMSGGMQPGKSPEEKLEGIPFFEEVRDFVLRELRRFTHAYVTGTEIGIPRDEPVSSRDDSLDDEILITLREIRDLLRQDGRRED